MARNQKPARHAPWSAREDNELMELVGNAPPPLFATIWNRKAAQFGWPRRTLCALKHRAKRRGLSTRPVGSWLRLGDVASILQIRNLIIAGWIDRYDIPCLRVAHRVYLQRADIRRFAKQHPEVFASRSRECLFMLLEDDDLVERILAIPSRLNLPYRIRCHRTGRVFVSCADAAKAWFCCPSTVSKAIRAGHHSCVGYPFTVLQHGGRPSSSVERAA